MGAVWPIFAILLAFSVILWWIPTNYKKDTDKTRPWGAGRAKDKLRRHVRCHRRIKAVAAAGPGQLLRGVAEEVGAVAEVAATGARPGGAARACVAVPGWSAFLMWCASSHTANRQSLEKEHVHTIFIKGLKCITTSVRYVRLQRK